MTESNTPKITDPELISLRDATLDIERHVNRFGWDAPMRLFALVKARAALDKNPELEDELPADVAVDSIEDPNLLFSVEQEDLPEVTSLGDLLARIVWPEDVDGAAVSVERIVLPPSVEVSLPEDEEEALKVLQNHPQRQDVRIVGAVLRDGRSWCVIRMRKFDDDAKVLSGENLVPGIVEGLKATFVDSGDEA